MKTTLPFRLENERMYLRKIHPLTRLILPFICVIPFVLLNDIYLVFSILLVVFVTALILRLKILDIFSRLKLVIPIVFLLTIFIPLYVGDIVLYQFNIGIRITVFKEGFILASLIFFRVFGALFVFMSFFSTLTYSEFIDALTKLRIPSIFVGSLIIMLHYIPILAKSNAKILEAQEMRGKNISTYYQKLKIHAFIMGKSIVTNMERSEKLYESLKMRGFSGKITFTQKKFSLIDIGFFTFFIVLLVFMIFILDLQSIYQGVITLFLP
ncbi:MAG: energy-coupling factor transporter transmembrane protein EcfT [Candidatus Lokiarchaeota archaeon]|nr:energy-coupling factor transporter transmembrane protein EcfT [Candidatus Lokiarchaeota archaeon]